MKYVFVITLLALSLNAFACDDGFGVPHCAMDRANDLAAQNEIETNTKSMADSLSAIESQEELNSWNR